MFVLLQTTIENSTEFNETVHQLTDSSIKLAEAAANFGALKVIFGVFLVFVLIMMIAFFWQLFSTQKRLTDVHSTTAKVEKYMEEQSSRTIGKTQSAIMIRRAFNSLAQNVKYVILRTRIENHLDQKDRVQSKISSIVKTEYEELISFLANFECEGADLSEALDAEDAKLIVDFMLEQIYLDKDQFTIWAMDQATDILIRGLKLEALQLYN